MSLPYWRLSGFYFFYFATLGSFMPFWSLYLKDIGFNSVQIGELFAILVGTKIIAPNIWGFIADHTRKSMWVIRFAALMSAVLFALFLSIHGYFWHAVVTGVFSFFWNAALPQFEAVTLFHLRDEPHRYSQIRLWGSIGFIFAVLGVGELMDDLPLVLLPIAITSLLALTGLMAVLVPDAHQLEHEKIAKGLGQIITQPEIIAFLIVGMLLQIAHSPYYVFYSVFLNQHQYPATLTGGLWALGVVAEILLFLLVKPLLAKFSLRSILLCSIALAAVRWLMIAWCVDYLLALVVAQLLHAATFGGTHVASIHLVHRYFGQRHQGKGQAFYGSVCYGLGGMLGSYFGGFYWESIGASTVYSIGAVICVIAWLIAYIWVGRESLRPASQA